MAEQVKVVAGTCPGVEEDPAALTSQPCLPVSHAGLHGGRLANIAMLMVLLRPCSSALQKSAVSSRFQRKATLLAVEKKAAPCFQLVLSL